MTMALELDLDLPFEAIIADMQDILEQMVLLHRRKRADYALDGDSLSNFFSTAAAMRDKGYQDFTALTSADYLLAVKEVRLEALAANGRMEQTANESVRDTLIDMCNYHVLRTAIYDRLHR